MSTQLMKGLSGEDIQNFVLTQSNNNKVSPNTVANPRVIHCMIAGNVVISWSDGTTTTFTFAEGDRFNIGSATLATISSGQFHFMV